MKPGTYGARFLDGDGLVKPDTPGRPVSVNTSGVTIQSTQGSGQTTIIGAGSRPAIEITASDVTVDDFEIRHPGFSTDFREIPAGDGVLIGSNNTGVSVRNCEIRDLGTSNDVVKPTGVVTGRATSGITIEDNQIETLDGDNSRFGNAVQAIQISENIFDNTSTENARVANNTITDLVDGASVTAIEFDGSVSGNVVGNTISELNTESSATRGREFLSGPTGGRIEAIQVTVN